MVSVTLENVTVEKALELLLAGTEYQIHATPDYYLVFSADEAAGMFPSVAETQMIAVQYVAPETARSLLPNPLQRYVRSMPDPACSRSPRPTICWSAFASTWSAIDRPNGDETVFIALDYVKAATARGLLPENLQRFVRTDVERNTLAVTAPQGSREQILGQIARLDVALPAGSFDMPNVHRTKVVKLNHTKALSALNLLTGRFGQLCQGGRGVEYTGDQRA